MSTRRDFFSAASAAGLTAVSYGRVLGANDKLNIGLIGSGNRGRSILVETMKLGHKCVALADVAGFRMGVMTETAIKPAKQEKPKYFDNHTDLLGHAGIDAVIVATPDHHHKACLIDACNAKKDVYVEKPLTKQIADGQAMIDAVRNNKRIVQVGNQRHSGPHWAKAREIVQSKEFGDLVWVKVWDCRNWVKKDPFAVPASFTEAQRKTVNWKAFLGNATDRPFDATRYWAWRWYWDYAGGLMTDIGAHQLDIVQWLSGVSMPKSAVANGGVYQFKHWETPDVVHGVWDYGTFAATFAVEFVNGFDGVGCAFYGTKMTLIADAEKEVRVYKTIDKPVESTKPIDAWAVPNETAMHVKNWLESVAARKDPHSPIELGHQVIVAAHMANESYRTGKRVERKVTS